MDWYSIGIGAAAATCLSATWAGVRWVGRAGGGQGEEKGRTAAHSRALALSGVEGPLNGEAWQKRLDAWDSRAEDYLRESEDPFPVERAGPNERVAVWHPDMDRCTTCGHVIGSSNTVNGVPFSLCEEARADEHGELVKPCGWYRSTLALDYDQWEQASAEGREAMLRLAYDTPTTMPEDEDIRAWYERRLLR